MTSHDRPVRQARRRTTTTPSAGRTRWTRPTSGRSRSPRTGAAPATARSSPGRTGHGEGRNPAPVPPRHRRRADDPRSRRAPGADLRPRRRSRRRSRASAWPTASTTPARPSARDPVLRDVRQPRHLPPGLDRGHAAQHAVGDGAELPHRRGRLGALRHDDDWSQAHDLAAEIPRSSPNSSGCCLDRGGEVQRAAARRPSGRAVQPRHRRSAAARPRARPRCSSPAWAD